MMLHVLYFTLAILVPYFAEQYAYWKSIPRKGSQDIQNTKTGPEDYGWRLIWDAGYFLVLVSAAYRIIGETAPLSVWEWVGYACFLLGVILRVKSLGELGRFYDPGIVIKTDHQIVQTGPYRFLRHPLHLGTILQITGLALFAPLWLRLPVVIASLLLGLYLNRMEDRAHAQKFGPSFRLYYLKTWDLIDLIFWKNKLGS
jgi:protein-S-isoprenylcysteine O-methyltransferase Ste14